MTVVRVPATPKPADEPILRTLCLALSDDLSLPLQCKFKLGHIEGHDWEIAKGLTDYRADQLRTEQDSPSGMLPRRTPGAALGDVEGESEPGVRPGCDRGSDRVLERWEA